TEVHPDTTVVAHVRAQQTDLGRCAHRMAPLTEVRRGGATGVPLERDSKALSARGFLINKIGPRARGFDPGEVIPDINRKDHFRRQLDRIPIDLSETFAKLFFGIDAKHDSILAGKA